MEVVGEEGVIEEVEHVNSFLGRFRGLMFREEGRILMEFPVRDKPGIWMPFMNFSIDVAFIDDEKKVVDLFKDVPPVSLSPSTWKIYRPETMCRYVLEVESGLLEEKGVEKGSEIGLKFF